MKVIHFPGGSEFPRVVETPGTLEDVRALVGGYIRPVSLVVGGSACTFFCDEDGQPKGLPRNDAFMHWLDVVTAPEWAADDYVGPIVVAGPLTKKSWERCPDAVLLTLSTPDWIVAIARRWVESRKARGWTQEDFAAALGTFLAGGEVDESQYPKKRG